MILRTAQRAALAIGAVNTALYIYKNVQEQELSRSFDAPREAPQLGERAAAKAETKRGGP